GLLLYSKPIADQRAAIAALAGKPATPTAPTVAGMPKAPDGLMAPVGTLPAVAVVPAGPAPAVTPAVALGQPPSTAITVPTITPQNAGPTAPAAPTTTAQVNLLDQAAAEMRRGDLEMARRIALQVHNSDPAAKVQAHALLRQIETEELVVKQRTARTA